MGLVIQPKLMLCCRAETVAKLTELPPLNNKDHPMLNLPGSFIRFLLLSVVLVAAWMPATEVEACEPAAAITRYERGICEDTTPFTLCHAGPCKSKLGALDAMGRFHVFKNTASSKISWLAWDTENLTRTLDEVVAVRDTSIAACGGEPVGRVAGCVERYRIPNVKACPLGQGPNCPGNKVTATLTSLEQVNEATTPGGIVTLVDGQTIEGKGRKRYWLHYEVCCPDQGQFGTPGDLLSTSIKYAVYDSVGGGIIGCSTKDTRRSDPRRIPDKTFPCGDRN